MELYTELSKVPGIGPKFIIKLKKLGVNTVKELLWHFPFRYEDYSNVIPISELKINESATIQAKIHQITIRSAWKRNLLIIEAILVDNSGGVKAVWFNQPYIKNTLKEGNFYNFAGKITKSKREFYLASPSFEPIGDSTKGETKHTAGLIPIYPETRGLTSKGLRFLIKPLLKQLDHIEDFLPQEIIAENKLPDINIALRRIHFPLKPSDPELSKKRFAFENLFLLQLNNLKLRSQLSMNKALPIQFTQENLQKIIAGLPFQLTESQKISLHEVLENLQRPYPMNRLLQGDVGSGKTIIAAVAALLAAQNGCQTAFMAPTEILAGQHFRTMAKIFPQFDKGIALLTANKTEIYKPTGPISPMGPIGPIKSIAKSRLLKEIADGEIKIVIGTHAVISARGGSASGRQKGLPAGRQGISFKNLGLAIVDEQHRFGVSQRAALITNHESGIGNSGEKESLIHNSKFMIPHFLSMSATPIPRTVAMTVFGDLDLSTITELPPGRKEIITRVVAPENRKKAYDFIRDQIKKGRQAFVICPRIEPAQTQTDADGTQTNAEKIQRKSALSPRQSVWLEVKSVKEEFEKLSTKVFPDLKIAMLHGKVKGKEKDGIMRDFQDKKYDILIATSVIEVGVDVPNASIMMIEGAERFGLAQLYQFRGRVGRSEHQSYCLLFTESDTETAQKRLYFLLNAKNGFELAEKDLEMRGPGQFLGEAQTGLPDIAMNAIQDILLVKASRDAAAKILSNDPDFKNYPLLAERFAKFQKNIHLE